MKQMIGSFLICLCLLTCGCPYKSYDPAGFDQLLRSDSSIQLLDVRMPAEFAAGAIPGAGNLDVKQEDFALRADSLLDQSRPVAVYCKGGVRSRKAARQLTEKGYTVYNLDKGYDSWAEYHGEGEAPENEASQNDPSHNELPEKDVE